jgi:hypothetical protein
MSNTNTQEGYNGIYLERSGRDSRVMAETLVEPPELPLDDSQKQEVYGFEGYIRSYGIEAGLNIGDVILSHKDEMVTAPRFFAKAFLDGKIDIPKTHGNAIEFSSPEDVYKWLAKGVQELTVDEPTLLRMSKDSVGYYKRSIAESLIKGEPPELIVMDNMPIVLNPEETIIDALSALQARQFLRQLHRDYKEGGNRLDGAKRAIIEVYLAKVNSLAVGDITTLDYLVEQANLIGDNNTAEAASGIIPPSIRQALGSDNSRTIKRLDYLRNGMGLDSEGHATVVDNAITQTRSQPEFGPDTEPPLFTPQQCEKLKKYKINPQQMVEIYSRVLQQAGLLSSEDPSAWYPKRANRAADNLFQVVINPNNDTFVTNGGNGSFKVASEERSLFDVIVVGGFHELEHVNQAQADFKFGEKLKIAKNKGKRVNMLRESGANYKQREAERALFGQSKPLSFAYAEALKVIDNGGNLFEAAQAFYNEKKRVDHYANQSEIAEEAADRVLRLIRFGGFNSQPLAYVEGTILDHELRGASVEVKSRALAVTCLDLVDQVRLHKYDLLPNVEEQRVDWTRIILKEVDPYIIKALST